MPPGPPPSHGHGWPEPRPTGDGLEPGTGRAGAGGWVGAEAGAYLPTVDGTRDGARAEKRGSRNRAGAAASPRRGRAGAGAGASPRWLREPGRGCGFSPRVQKPGRGCSITPPRAADPRGGGSATSPCITVEGGTGNRGCRRGGGRCPGGTPRRWRRAPCAGSGDGGQREGPPYLGSEAGHGGCRGAGAAAAGPGGAGEAAAGPNGAGLSRRRRRAPLYRAAAAACGL